MVVAVPGVILHEKNSAKPEVPQICPSPVKCLWLKSKIAQLSPTPTCSLETKSSFLDVKSISKVGNVGNQLFAIYDDDGSY